MYVCMESSEATVCHRDCKLNISLPTHIAIKAIKRGSLPGGRRGEYLKVHIQAPSHLSLKTASLSWKPSPITVARKVWKYSSRQSHAVKVSGYLSLRIL